MKLFAYKSERIKNLQKIKLHRDFNFNPFSFLVLGLFLLAGIMIQYFSDWSLDRKSVV